MSEEMETLVAAIRGYCEAVGITAATFGTRVVNDGKFVGRLERGGQCLPSTMAKVRRYMADHPPEQADAPADAAGSGEANAA